MRNRRFTRLCRALSAILACVAATASAADAAVIQVNTTADETTPGDGRCSLREAISQADGPVVLSDCTRPDSGANTISLPAQPYPLTIRGADEDANATGDLDIAGTARNLTIQGAGPGMTTIDATALGDRVLDIANGATVTISGVTITGGRAPSGASGSGGSPSGADGESGGAIRNAGSLTLSTDIVAGNRAGDGGAGESSNPPGGSGGTGGSGGAIENAGTLTLTDVALSRNAAGDGGPGGGTGAGGGSGGFGGDGGGLDSAQNGKAIISASTISGNLAGAGGNGGDGGGFGNGGNGGQGGDGGGVYLDRGAALTASNDTLSGNFAGVAGDGASGIDGGGGAFGGTGGAVMIGFQANAVLSNLTVAGNGARSGGQGGTGMFGGTDGAAGADGTGGGVAAFGGSCFPCTLQASIVALNELGNCSGPITGTGHNLSLGDATCPAASGDPKLGPLQDNGGPTQTMALGAGSAATDAIPTVDGCPATDQRGVARPVGAACDIGAYEWGPPVLRGTGANALGPTSAIVATVVIPNARDTTVTIRYGVTPAYGAGLAPIDAGSATTIVRLNRELTGLLPGTTYHAQLTATNGDGTTASPDLVFTTPQLSGPPVGGGAVPPSITRLRQSASRWREGNGLARITRRRATPTGTMFSFALNERAAVVLSFAQTRPGRRVGRRCLARSRTNARRPRCALTKVAGTLAFSAHGGTSTVRFEGRLTRQRRLSPGAYALTATATNSSRQRTTSHALRFTIVP